MNGQQGRQAIVREISRSEKFAYAVETGTWLGGSTAFIADVFGCSVWSVEADLNAFQFASRTLGGRPDICLEFGDTRVFLSDIALRLETDVPVFFYLDAHWDDADLPLWEEIRIIFEAWSQPVVLIDDFAVPGDDGYGFDDYGPGRSLTLATLSGHLPPGVVALFPVLASTEESGARRGCCVLKREASEPSWSTGLLAGAATDIQAS
jgi:hypothetical protein